MVAPACCARAFAPHHSETEFALLVEGNACLQELEDSDHRPWTNGRVKLVSGVKALCCACACCRRRVIRRIMLLLCEQATSDSNVSALDLGPEGAKGWDRACTSLTEKISTPPALRQRQEKKKSGSTRKFELRMSDRDHHYRKVLEAYDRVKDVITRTPLLTSSSVDQVGSNYNCCTHEASTTSLSHHLCLRTRSCN